MANVRVNNLDMDREGTGQSSTAATMVWGIGQSMLLKDYKDNYSTPNLVKIVKGEYMNIGARTSPKDKKESEVLLHSVESTTKVLSLNLQARDGRHVTDTDQKLSIPASYDGWFEVVSEDGRQIRAIENVSDLARIFPHTCLVRQNIKAFLAKDNGDLAMDRYQIVQAGETLTLLGRISSNVSNSRGCAEVRILRCLDSKGESVYFTYDQKGVFSPVAGRGNISGVHRIQGVLDKFHLPVTVKLVHGSYPKQMPVGKFSGFLRLIYVYQDEVAFMCPSKGNYKMLPISTQTPLKVLPAANFDELKDNVEIKEVLRRCSKMVKSYLSTIHVLYGVNIPPPKNQQLSNPFITLNERTEKLGEQKTSPQLPKAEEDQLFEEVEDIYLYVVRHGVTPPVEARQTSTDPDEKDYWEEPVFQTLHKKRRNRESVIDVAKRMDPPISDASKSSKNKVFRFYHGLNQENSRSLAFVRTDTEKVDQVLAIEKGKPPPVPPKLFDRTHSLEDLVDGVEENEKRKKSDMMKRRKSQPAILRIFSKDKRSGKKMNDMVDDGSGESKGSNSMEEEKEKKKRISMKLKQLYV